MAFPFPPVLPVLYLLTYYSLLLLTRENTRQGKEKKKKKRYPRQPKNATEERKKDITSRAKREFKRNYICSISDL